MQDWVFIRYHLVVARKVAWKNSGAIALSYPPRVRVRATVKHSAAFFHDESSITIEGVQKYNSAKIPSTLPLVQKK